jgi:UMP-CMP kinase
MWPGNRSTDTLIGVVVDGGGQVPDDLLVMIVERRIAQADCQQRGWLLDGFPRTLAQAERLRQAGVVPSAVILLDVPEAEMLERVTGRRVDPATDNIYHVTYKLPETEEVAERLAHRADDTEDNAMTRCHAFRESIQEITKQFGSALFRVDASAPASHISQVIADHLRSLFQYEVVFVLGGPGCGKGTQCARISETFGYCHLSAGDLLREERAKASSALGNLINDYIREGKIVPAEITIRLLLAAMAAGHAENGQRKYLIDGFPRNHENMTEWFRICGGQVDVKCVLVFDCPEDVLQERLLKRGQSSGRIDDQVDAIQKRFAVFKNESMPVIQDFQRMGLARIISSIPPPNEVFESVSRVFRGFERFPVMQRTLALIKPDAVAAGHTDAIVEEVKKSGLAVVAQKTARLTLEQAEQFYAEHANKRFFRTLVKLMTDGDCVALLVEGRDALRSLRYLVGPTQRADTFAPQSIRARFGTDMAANAAHASDSVGSAIREINFWFGRDNFGSDEAAATAGPFNAYGLVREETVVGVKPAAWQEHGDAIRDVLVAHGYSIRSELSKELDAAESDHLGLAAAAENGWLGAPSAWLHLSRDGALAGLQLLVGPEALGAQFGDVFHAAADASAAAQQIAHLFPLPN